MANPIAAKILGAAFYASLNGLEPCAVEIRVEIDCAEVIVYHSSALRYLSKGGVEFVDDRTREIKRITRGDIMVIPY